MLDHNLKLTIQCRSRYEPSQKHYIVCQFGLWQWLNGEPLACNPKSCFVTSSNIRDNEYQNISPGVALSHGDFYLLCADSLYQFKNGHDGKISCAYGKLEPRRFPDCELIPCPSTEVINGAVIEESAHGTEEKIWCQDGYSVAGDHTYIKCHYGQWQPPDTPVCTKGINFSYFN